jgi:hypothetical protein
LSACSCNPRPSSSSATWRSSSSGTTPVSPPCQHMSNHNDKGKIGPLSRAKKCRCSRAVSVLQRQLCCGHKPIAARPRTSPSGYPHTVTLPADTRSEWSLRERERERKAVEATYRQCLPDYRSVLRLGLTCRRRLGRAGQTPCLHPTQRTDRYQPHIRPIPVCSSSGLSHRADVLEHSWTGCILLAETADKQNAVLGRGGAAAHPVVLCPHVRVLFRHNLLAGESLNHIKRARHASVSSALGSSGFQPSRAIRLRYER